MGELISDFEKLSSLLAGAYAAVALLLTLVLVFFPKKDLAVKLLGSLMVLSIMFGANNGWIYAVGIFIVATLVTELQFLEKLAALAWNRKEYWDYLGQASQQEIDSKLNEEVSEIVESELAEESAEETPQEEEAVEETSQEEEVNRETEKTDFFKDKGTVKEAIKRINEGKNIRLKIYEEASSFQRIALIALLNNKDSLFPKKSLLQKHVTINTRTGSRVLDAIIKTKDCHYIVEIKYIRSSANLTYAADKTMDLVFKYLSYIKTKNSDIEVYPVLIVPDNLTSSSLHNNVPILRFNTQTNSFSNVQAFKDSIKTVKNLS